VVPYAPICGPDVWYGQQQRQQQEQWVHTLTVAQIEELEAAVAAVQQRLQLQTRGNYITGVSAAHAQQIKLAKCCAPIHGMAGKHITVNSCRKKYLQAEVVRHELCTTQLQHIYSTAIKPL
jgi:hypothetical protein